MPQKRKGNIIQQFVDVMDLDFLLPGRSDVVDEELEFDEEGTKASQASKEFFTDLFTWLVNYRSNQLDVVEGGVIKRKYTWEIDDTKDLANAFIDDMYKRYMGKPIPDKK